MSLGLAPANPLCSVISVSVIVVLVELTLVCVPLTVKLPPTVTSPDVAIVVIPVKAPLVNVAVPSVTVEDVTLVNPDNVASRFTVNVLPDPTVVMFVPPAISSVSLSKSMLRAPPESPWKSKSDAVS